MTTEHKRASVPPIERAARAIADSLNSCEGEWKGWLPQGHAIVEALAVAEITASLEEMLDFVVTKYEWASVGGRCDVETEQNICAECREAGCISDKIHRAKAAIAKAKGG